MKKMLTTIHSKSDAECSLDSTHSKVAVIHHGLWLYKYGFVQLHTYGFAPRERARAWIRLLLARQKKTPTYAVRAHVRVG